jgi:hypothetical protein
MVLNATNSKIVKKFAKSPFIEDWKNIPIEIYVQSLKAFGEETEGLRIKETMPAIQKVTLSNSMGNVWVNAVNYYKEHKDFTSIESRYQLTEEAKKQLIEDANK